MCLAEKRRICFVRSVLSQSYSTHPHCRQLSASYPFKILIHFLSRIDRSVTLPASITSNYKRNENDSGVNLPHSCYKETIDSHWKSGLGLGDPLCSPTAVFNKHLSYPPVHTGTHHRFQLSCVGGSKLCGDEGRLT